MQNPLRMERLAYKSIGSETIILDSKIGKEVHQLNEVAAFIWNHCDGNNDIPALVNLVCEEFDVDYDVASGDVQSFINELKSKSLLA